MATYLSPGVYSREKDLSEIVPNVATTSAALVGYSTKGSIDKQLITSKQQFISEYGEPVVSQYFHYSALAFLAQGNTLWCKRVAGTGALYGGFDVYNEDAVESLEINGGFDAGTSDTVDEDGNIISRGTEVSWATSDEVLFKIFAKDQGAWGNNIKIDITTITDTTYPDTAITADTTEQYTFVIDVYYKTAKETKYAKVESWKVSRQNKTDGYGKQLYLEDVINGYSKYIYVTDNTLFADTVLPKANESLAESLNDGTTVSSISMAGGVNGAVATASQIIIGWGDFENPEDIDIRVLINGGEYASTVQIEMNRIAEARKDCIAILDMPYSQATGTVASMLTYRDTLAINSSYSCIYSPWVKDNDSYNDKILILPPSGYVAAQFAFNDNSADVWNAPAGFRRGQLPILAVSSVFTAGERDNLYKSGINPLQTFRGQGNVIWGQKTLQRKASALDRVNVRRLLIVMEKAISIAMQGYLFEPNSTVTRLRIEAVINRFMDDLSARGAFQTEGGDKGYLVVVDTTNNTPAVIDRNELHVDVFVKPSRVAEFIQLQTIVTSSGASFNELVSQGVLF